LRLAFVEVFEEFGYLLRWTSWESRDGEVELRWRCADGLGGAVVAVFCVAVFCVAVGET